jgi:conjugative relaxase-like TrwC/TraI family protein
MLTIRAMSDGKGYASRHLEHNDYYAEGERVAGRWHGRGVELLGISGEVKPGDFEFLRRGMDPDGNFLRQRKSADRISADGSIQSHGRHLFDFTISAPKSVSIMAGLGADPRLMEAHRKAVQEALRELELYAATRVRKNLANQNRTTGNLVIAAYHHDSSRELDPQLHTHAVAANLTYDREEGRWKALQASSIYERRAYLTEVYRNALAREVQHLGYEIENRTKSRGRDCGFEIRGVPDTILERFSRRSRQRDEAIAKFIEINGRPPTDNEVAVLVRESRAEKLHNISTEAVRNHQLARLGPGEARVLRKVVEKAQTTEIAPAQAGDALQYAKDHVFERVSVARDHEILTEALRHGRGRIGLDDLKKLIAVQELSGDILRNGDEIATRASLERERQMIDTVNRGIGVCSRLGGGRPFLCSSRLNPEQKQVVESVLDSHDRSVSIQGAAGTGKTATLQEVRRGVIAAGQSVIALAPTRSAVDELRKVGFKDAVTIERLLQDRGMQAALGSKIMIVDEAGMVSGRQMAEILKLAELYSARIVFSGDTKQIQSVEACDALRVREKESRLHSVELNQVQRQISQDYREAIKELRRDPARGFEKLDRMGAIRQVPWLDRAKEVARAFSEDGARGRNPLVVCATHEEIDRVTHAIRMSEGKLGKGVQVGKDVSLNWTTAEKSDMSHYRPGLRLVFHRAVQGIGKSETVEVEKVEASGVTVRSKSGELRTITARQAKSFDVCERRDFDISTGDKLLLTANRREPGLRVTNGEIVTVDRVDSNHCVHLADGRMLPADFRQFTHGYAVTAHRSQGKSVDSVIISADGMPKELFYVAASRGRESVLVVTSDKGMLSESVGRSNARQSASELSRKSRPGLHQGLHRGIEAAGNLARWMVQTARHWTRFLVEPDVIPEPVKPANRPFLEEISAPSLTERPIEPPATLKAPVSVTERRPAPVDRRSHDIEFER